MIAAFHQEHPAVPLAQLCAWAGVSRSWFYKRPATLAVSEEGTALRDKIEQIVLEFPGYGYRRVTAALQQQGICVNHKRILRVMRKESLLCVLKKRFVATTDSDHGERVYPNRLKEMTLTGLNEAWVSDITYIRLPSGFCYLAAVLDAFSRRCVGWALSKDIDTRLCLSALEMALVVRCPPLGLVHHSDRGVQYASIAYVTRLEEAGILSSMSAKANPYENAKAESFFKTLKTEEVYLKDYRTVEEAQAQAGAFIECVYNQKRLHSRLGYRSPVAFEATLINQLTVE